MNILFQIAEAAPAPTPLGPPPDPWLVLARGFLQLANVVVQAGTMIVFAVMALGVAYLLMTLVKTALRQALPEHYRKLLGPVLGFLVIVLAGVVYFLSGGGRQGLFVTVAAALGAAASSPIHRLIDGIAALKKSM